MALVCPKWGDTSLWGDGDLWCGISGSFQYVADIGRAQRPFLTSWNLQSPDTKVWTPSISTAGIFSISDGVGTASEVPVLPTGTDNTWEPSVSNAGLITLTSGTDADAQQASLIDVDSVQWYWSVPADDGISEWNDRQITSGRFKGNRVSIQVVYNDGDRFIIDRIGLQAMVAAQRPDRFVAYTDFVSHKRLSVQVVYAGGDSFVVEYIQMISNVKKHQTKG